MLNKLINQLCEAADSPKKRLKQQAQRQEKELLAG